MKRFVTLLGVILLFHSSCLLDVPDREQDKRGVKRSEKIRVTASRVISEEVPFVMKAKGRLVPFEKLEVKAPGAVKVRRVFVEEGQRVSQGENLIQFEEADIKAGLEFAQAEVREAEAAIDDYAYMVANKEKLLEEENISETVAGGLAKKVSHYKAKLERAKVEVEILEKRESPELYVTAPFDGLISHKGVSDGAVPKEGTLMLELVKMDPLKLVFSIPHEFVEALSRETPVRVRFASDPRREYTSEIRMIGPEVDKARQTIEIKAIMANDGETLKPGQSADVSINTDRWAKILYVPKEAVFEEGGTSYVYRFEKERLQKVSIETGDAKEGRLTISRGLKENDLVVVSDRQGLRNGLMVDMELADE